MAAVTARMPLYVMVMDFHMETTGCPDVSPERNPGSRIFHGLSKQDLELEVKRIIEKHLMEGSMRFVETSQ